MVMARGADLIARVFGSLPRMHSLKRACLVPLTFVFPVIYLEICTMMINSNRIK